MTTQKPISKSPISDAFLSKNADGNYLSNDCFYAGCENNTSFHFTGKEKDPETGYSYFGARYLEHDLMTGWLSVDPMADKYPSISPYAYCAWNPLKLVDPDGRDGVKIIDKETKTITVRANYYVTTEMVDPNGREIVFSTQDVEKMTETINNCINSDNYQVLYEGNTYQVVFDLRFYSGGDDNHSTELANNDVYQNIPIGNTLRIMSFSELSQVSKDLKIGIEDHTCSLGGVTQDSKYINMSPLHKYYRNIIHEIFHTLFYDNDDAPTGIGSYIRLDLPDWNDINNTILNDKLPTITL